MPNLETYLLIPRCPFCSVSHPNLQRQSAFFTNNSSGTNGRHWGVYICKSCGGVVTAWSRSQHGSVEMIHPTVKAVGDSLPTKAKSFLEQAINSLHAPSGAIMLAASSVDDMLKSKGYVNGKLFKRIDKAAADHLITDGMAQWAHQIRLDANDERHADIDAELPSPEDAQRSIDFALALAEFLFVLPERVTRGLVASSPKQDTPPTTPQ